MREAQGEARRRRRRTCTSGDTGCRAVSCSIWPCLRTRWPARITVSAGCRRRSRRAAGRGRAWLQRGGHAVQARVEGSMIAPGAERRRRPWQSRAAPALSRGRAPRSSRRSRAGVGELVRAWVRRPARCAAARVLRPARALAPSTAEPWRPAASPRAVARGGVPFKGAVF